METEEKALCPPCGCVTAEELTAEEPTCLDCWREIYKAREQAIERKRLRARADLDNEIAYIQSILAIRKNNAYSYVDSLRAACRTARLLKQELARVEKLTVADCDWPNWEGKTKAP